MVLLLNSENIFSYLSDCGLLNNAAQSGKTVPALDLILESKPGKNFNVRVRYGSADWLVKQESHGLEGQAAGELRREQQFFGLLERFPRLSKVRSQVVLPRHFDRENSIIVFPYLATARDLSDVYRTTESLLRPRIAAQLGSFFGTLHSSTFDDEGCQTFATDLSVPSHSASHHRNSNDCDVSQTFAAPDFLKGLKCLTPESFCVIPTDALKFFRFYQRYPNLEQAIEHISQAYEPCCIVHNDPRFANFLFCEEDERSALQPIDWEKWGWGDPTYDLARLVASYLKLWLKSLPISSEIDLSTALSHAKVPLSAVQPNAAALVKAYLTHFPNILLHRPRFIPQLVQFAGLALIRQVQLYIAQKQPFGNVGMAIAQVGKTLLCQPESAISTVFGCDRRALEEALLEETHQNDSATDSKNARFARDSPSSDRSDGTRNLSDCAPRSGTGVRR